MTENIQEGVVLTPDGKKKLEDELYDLKVVKRAQVVKDIAEARAHGDLSENAEYDEAKNDQAILEARIADLEVMLSNAQVIERNEMEADTVHIGSSIEVSMKRAGGAETKRAFSIVGSNEANPREGRISDESAVGKALIGKKVGDKVSVETPAGVTEYVILSVS